MLQQTQAARVDPAFRSFVRRFPSVRALAAASRADVLRAWSGLGYNRRAVNLHEAARTIVRDHGGRVPSDPEALRTLPGIGPYTAAAVASIAFGRPVAVTDTNVRRVLGRIALGRDAGEVAMREAATLSEAWLDRRDPASWNQALMDLGRDVCRPRPRCDACPVASRCRFLAAGASLRPPVRKQTRFEGSQRQVRGAVVREVAAAPTTIARLAEATGVSEDRVGRAVRDLAAEGVVEASPVALRGDRRGKVRLPR